MTISSTPPIAVSLAMGESKNYVLNANMQYDSGSVPTLKKWLDINNIFSCRKNKTIYVIKAVGSWQANVSYYNAQFYGNTGADNNGVTNTEQWRGFATNDLRSSALNLIPRTNIYGNISSNLLSDAGISGSLINGFHYLDNGANSINVSANLHNFHGNGNLSTNGGFPSQLNGINVDTRTAQVSLLYSNAQNQTYQWNRLINANIAGNLLVNASCDPCDISGHGVHLPNGSSPGNAYSNELYRHQFAERGNINASGIDLNNPIYMVRLERFGRNISANVSSLAGNVFLSQFTSDFFAHVANHANDNRVYANSNDILKNIEITGSVLQPVPTVINGAFSDNNNGTSGHISANTHVVPSSFNLEYNVSLNTSVTNPDSVSELINPSYEYLNKGDSMNFIQGNIIDAPSGVFLVRNVNVGSNIILKNNASFNHSDAINHFEEDLVNNTNITLSDPKVITIFGSNISPDNWTVTNVYNNVPVPSGPLVPSWTPGQPIDLYCVKGSVRLDNFILGSNSNVIAGNPYISSVPSYIGNVIFNNSSIVLDDNGGITGNGNLSTYSYGINRTFSYNNGSVTLSANTAPEYHIFVFGNSKENERADVHVNSVVTNQNSYMAKAWVDSVTPKVRVVYDNTLSSALSINGALAKSTPSYKVVFGNWVGKSVVPSHVKFSPNLSVDGITNNYGSVISNDYVNLSSSLNSNHHLKSLCLNGVLYTDYIVDNGIGSKWTDQGNVCNLNAGNYTYKTLLPKYGNILASGHGEGYSAISDTFLNTLVSYTNAVNDISPTDVHKVVVYDLQYKAYVDAVKRPGTSDINNTMGFYDNNGVFNSINSDVFMNNTYNSEVKGNLSAQPFLTFCYTGMIDSAPKESLYPFFSANDTQGRIAARVENDANYLFPGFIYKSVGGSSQEFYTYKSALDCDFEINTDISTSGIRNFRIYAYDNENKSVKIALDSNVAKSIPIRPIKLGRRHVSNSVSAMNWYSYVTVYLTNASGSRDYMVLLFALQNNNANPDEVPSDLPSNVKDYLPVTIQVKPVSSWNQNKVKFSVALRAFNQSGTMKESYNSNSDYSEVVDLNTFYTPSNTNAVDSVVSVNIFSQPINNLIVTMQYSASTIKSLITYSKKDYDSNSVLIEGSTQQKLYGIPFQNSTNNYIVDSNNSALLKIAPNTTRYYLDGMGSAVYVDMENTSQYSEGFTLKVYRSISYQLLRNSVVVGSGLMSRSPFGSLTAKSDDVITENTASLKAGFVLTFTHNLIDLCARLQYQSENTHSAQNNLLEFNINTLPDKLNINVASYRSDNNSYIRVEKVVSNVLASNSIDLSALFQGSLPTITLTTVRGYPYNLDITNGSGLSSNSGNFVPVTLSNVLKACFRIKIVPDNYTLFNTATGTIMNGGGKSVFSTTLHPSTNIPNDFILSYNNRTISSFLVGLPLNTNTKLLTMTNSGYGTVNYIIEEFSGHYNTTSPLQEYTLSLTPTNTGALAKNLNHTINAATVGTSANVLIMNGKYCFNIVMSNNQTHTVNFANAGVFPDSFNGKYTSILYTGRRVLVLHNAGIDNNGTTYQHVVDNLFSFSSARNVLVGQPNAALVNSSIIYAQSYAVVLLNVNKTSENDHVNYRGLKINIKGLGVTNRTLSWFGVYVYSSSFLSNLKLRLRYGNSQVNETPINAIFEKSGSVNYETNDDEIINKVTVLRNTFNIKMGNTQLFKLLVKGSLATTNSFVIEINPAKAYFYEANDQNSNNMIDINPISSSICTPNYLSDIAYTISSSMAITKYNKPRFIVDMNNSINYNEGWVSVLGTHLDLKFSNKFSVGYSTDCYFVFQNNNSATFDVLEIASNKHTLNQNTTQLVSSITYPLTLTAVQRRRLRISTASQWCVSNNTDSGCLSGLTFKISPNAVINDGDIVNVFCENASNIGNTLNWTVKNAQENNPGKTISLSSYDEERYATLLNNQLRYDQKIE
jgi:hypothetical protein